MTIKIDKDVPLPTKVQKYPFDEMAIGDSFWVGKWQTSMTSSIHGAQKRTGFRFTARPRQKDGVMGCRIWRIE